MKIAIARDEAFNFVYPACIEDLRRMGKVIFFSPLRDDKLPDCDLLYLPGGYPELFAEKLSQNVSMRKSIRTYAESNGKIFAECGGFMYLCSQIDGIEMCGVLPLNTTMKGARLHLGYRQMDVEGQNFRGHEFHYSTVEETTLPPAVQAIRLQSSAKGKSVDTPIYLYRNVVAGYTHWYWAETKFESLWQAIRKCSIH